MLERGIHSTTGKPIKVTPEALEKFAEVYEYPYNLLMIAAGYGEYAAVMDEMAVSSEPLILKEEPAGYYVNEEYLTSLQNSYSVPEADSTNPTEEKLTDRLIQLRLQEGLSHKELALSIASIVNRHFTTEEINKIETGELKPDSDFLIAASQLYDVSTHWILTGEQFKSKRFKTITDANTSIDTILEKLNQIKKESDNITKVIRNSLPDEVKQKNKS